MASNKLYYTFVEHAQEIMLRRYQNLSKDTNQCTTNNFCNISNKAIRQFDEPTVIIFAPLKNLIVGNFQCLESNFQATTASLLNVKNVNRIAYYLTVLTIDHYFY